MHACTLEAYVEATRMVVTMIQGLELGEEGAKVLPERMTPSSQGGLPMFASGLLYYAGPHG